MTDQELKVDRKEFALGCAVIIGCALILLAIGCGVGIYVYKNWIL